DGDRMIAEYALLQALRHHRYMPEYIAAQSRAEWFKHDVRLAAERRVGFMGLGLIGMAAARLVRDVGFQVAAWTRTRRDEPGIESFHGADQLEPFLARSEIVINLLPLTADTGDIICARTLDMLPEGAALINLGRGQHVVDDDLIAALDSGRLGTATLDVFRTEPLPADHPFWRHPKITLLPHTARKTRPGNAIPQVADNIRRLRAGEPLLQTVNRDAGY
ncbi:MAG: 2-hydroxyacid dehydrogenase, partial [Alphaproteobacteria bacterium]